MPDGPTAIRECGPLAPADARDAAVFDRLWHLERNGPGWTGGDGVFSVRMDDGRIAWLFGDSFVGGVLADGSRSPDWRMVRNTVVIQDGGCLTTLIGGTAQAPTALLQPSDAAAWYWPQDATVDQQVLHVVALRVIRTGTTAWDFSVVGVDLVDLDLRSFTVDAVRTLVGNGSVLWGSSVLETGAATYVYGVENTAHDARVFLARAGNRMLGGKWLFYRGGPEPWSSDARDAAPLAAAVPDEGDEDPPPPLTGVSSAVSVFADREGVVLISQAPEFGTEIMARRAPAPEGPFAPPQTIAIASPPPGASGAFTYGARAHPDLAAEPLQLLSWNVSSFGDILADATLYRPRFDSFTWPPADTPGGVVSLPRAPGAPRARPAPPPRGGASRAVPRVTDPHP